MSGRELTRIVQICKRLKPFVLDKKKAPVSKTALTKVCVRDGYAYATTGTVLVRMDLGFESDEVLLLEPDLSVSSDPDDFPDVEKIIERANSPKASGIALSGTFATEWKRIFTYASTIAKGSEKQMWIAVKGHKLYAFAGNNTIQSCFILGSSEQEAEQAINCVSAAVMYNVANLLNDLGATECTLHIPDQQGQQDYGFVAIASPGVKIVLAPVKSDEVLEDPEHECAKVSELMERVLSGNNVRTSEAIAEQSDGLDFLE